ncbi:hypothetical protein GCM10011611_51330 [Aliidongia dinghuensis]|uniref:Probable 2-phosphosulfolactate phosphatase n=1 Tax=Aliidongia dinghuensis TaxID=1867774 RepID=A0A8J2YYI3_9PROT|nr:hypothetical protein GCM10011611_51330 [Aliidongia dinghuensis]
MGAHCEWGLAGVEALRARVAVLVIVDVLSFSTAVDVAVSLGASVIPFPLGDAAAARAAAEAAGAVLATPRRAIGGQYSLSPASLVGIPPGTRLMLPSPNGARLSLAGGTTPVLAGCFRNAGAVAQHAEALAQGGAIGVIPAGERWPDGSLRPAIEDWLGAGAILDALDRTLSAEARIARDAYRSVGMDLPTLVQESLSGRELIHGGFPADVEIALDFDISQTVPVLVDGAYRAG